MVSSNSDASPARYPPLPHEREVGWRFIKPRKHYKKPIVTIDMDKMSMEWEEDDSKGDTDDDENSKYLYCSLERFEPELYSGYSITIFKDADGKPTWNDWSEEGGYHLAVANFHFDPKRLTLLQKLGIRSRAKAIRVKKWA